MLLCKQKKNQGPKGNRILVSITFLGSAGPIRFVVSEEQLVTAVIHTALKAYAREGRLPVLRSDIDDFLLHCPSSGSDALRRSDRKGRGISCCARNQGPRVWKMLEDQVGQYLGRELGIGRLGFINPSVLRSLPIKICPTTFT